MEGHFAVDKVQQKVVKCDSSINCENCIFRDTQGCFESDKIKWLYQEYNTLTNNDIDLIKTLNRIKNKEYKFIARRGNEVFLFSDRPKIFHTVYGTNYSSGGEYFHITEVNRTENLFPNIKQKDGLYDIENKTFIK